MFKRSLLSLVLIAGLACPVAAVAAEGDSVVTRVTEQVCEFVKDNQIALGGAAVVTTAAVAALVAWYYGYFTTTENNQVA